MPDARWQRVKELFEAALDRPAAERDAFLASASGGDGELRREVESLLASDAADAGMLDQLNLSGGTPLGDLSTMIRTSMGDVRSQPMLEPGALIGAYEVVALIGAGAMGEVYRARDGKLNRDVALKVLPPLFAIDPDRLSRFRREAQVLAALNHPNIGAIYGFEDSGDMHALVLELVDGPTLADRIARGPLPLATALDIGRQIADALDAAHEKGIIHRDLKPANIKIDGTGAVKVLDFGLAKPVIPDDVRPDLTASHDGLILGTASYMSPEQARGLKVDRRSDIWAFGCVLYEMLTGRLAFPGATVSDIIAKILEREPDWSALPAATPPFVQRLLRRCLTKDPRRRLRDIGDVMIEIDAIDDVPLSISEGPGDPRRRRRGTWLPWIAVAMLAAAVVLWEWRRPAIAQENPLANAEFKLLTNWEGEEEDAEISPDGRFVAFLADRDGEFDIWLTQVGTGLFSNLTKDFPPLAAAGAIVRKLGFNGDGSEIWFNPGDGKPLMLMPALTGASPRPFLGQGANTPAWSPDGTRLVYVYKSNGDDPIYLADRTGSEAQVIMGPDDTRKNVNPVWSPDPDNQWIYFVRGTEPQDEAEMDAWRLRPSGGLPERVTQQHLAMNYLAPLNAHTFLYVARAENGSGPWLWTLDVERKTTRRVAPGVDQFTSVSSSRDGRRIVATVANPGGGLWRVPILDHVAEDRDVRPYTLPVPTGRALAPRFAGTALFYLSTRGTEDGLWKVQDGQASEVWRARDAALSEPPAVSPDGQHVAIVVRREGKRHLMIMSADGTNPQTLAPSIEIEGAFGQGAADWSPDGTKIVTGGRDANGSALFIIPIDTGVPIRLREGKWVNPVWSPDGTLIVYGGRSLIGQVPLLGVRPDGTPVKLPDIMVRPGGYRFLPDGSGSGLVYLPRIPSLDFWLLNFASGKSQPIARLSIPNQGAFRTFDLTRDGKSIVFDRSRQNSNIVLIDLPK